MELNMSDQDLINYVNRAINSGAKEISIPASLLAGASKEAVEEVRRLCKLCGVNIVNINA